MAGTKSLFGRVVGGPFFSPKGLLVRAAEIALLFVIGHVLGLRAYATILSGTSPTGGAADLWGILFACLYLLTYFASVVLVPIMIIGSLVLFAFLSLLPGKPRA
jgi:hypothetical protein